jgi:hypothetical protein
MQVSLKAMELWDVVEAECKERAKDRRVLDVIIRVVPAGMKSALAVKKTTNEAWVAVKSMHGSDDHIKASCMQYLWKEFENLSFREGGLLLTS